MRRKLEKRMENVECHYNGLRDDKGFDLLRECIKSVLDEQRAVQSRQKRQRKVIK